MKRDAHHQPLILKSIVTESIFKEPLALIIRKNSQLEEPKQQSK
jgi:hypothetical protein